MKSIAFGSCDGSQNTYFVSVCKVVCCLTLIYTSINLPEAELTAQQKLILSSGLIIITITITSAGTTLDSFRIRSFLHS